MVSTQLMNLWTNPTYEFLENIRKDPDTIAYWNTLPNRHFRRGVPSMKGLSLEMGLGKWWIESKYWHIRLGESEHVIFSSILKIKTFLKKFKNDAQADEIIHNYIDKFGTRHGLIFDIAEIFYKYTQVPLNVKDLSRIIFKNNDKLERILYQYGEQIYLNSFFELEYFISRSDLQVLSNSKLSNDIKKYLSDPIIVENIKKKCIKTIQEFLYDKKYISKQMDKRVFNLIWDSLYALSDVKTVKMRAVTGNNDVLVAAKLGDLGEIMCQTKVLEIKRTNIRRLYFSKLSLPEKKTVKSLKSALQNIYFYSPASVYKALQTCDLYLNSRFKYNSYDEYWYDESVVGYHITMALARNLGFDILHFQTLDNSIFSFFSSKTYARHHFRNEWNRKKSLLIKDIILTDNRLHASYEKYIRTIKGEQSIDNILKGFEQLMTFSGDVAEAEIQQIFKYLGEEWVYKLWKYQGQEKFDDNLYEFNKRKTDYKTNNIEEFIKKYYKLAYERFYGQYDIGIYETFARLPGVGDYLPDSISYLGTLEEEIKVF